MKATVKILLKPDISKLIKAAFSNNIIITYIMSPLHFIYMGVGVYDTVEINVCPFSYSVRVERSAQDYHRLRGICNTSSNYSRMIPGNCRLAY